MTTGPMVTRAARAKINLSLRVTGRRADGYHLLDSLVAFAEVGDRVTIRPADELSLTIDGPFGAGLAAETDNLVLRAARLLGDATNRPPSVAIHLEKNLPIASGIGGGSADAATTLLGLAELWGVGAAIDLEALGARLGADVAVCVRGVPARMSGIGEILSPVALPNPIPIVLVNPGAPVATVAVFKRREGDFSAPLPESSGALTSPEALAKAASLGGNDLYAPALALCPVIGEVVAALAVAEHPLIAAMSGSGATCFAIHASDAAANAAARVIQAAHPDWWVAATRLVAA